jgi:hypothetical protein
MKLTQGRQLIAHLKRGPMTTMELLRLGISACPWKRSNSGRMKCWSRPSVSTA